ncbi:MAG: DUF421 domain-containing protein [Actinomycetota bacterium]|nr:DUF421 domain-containing protein [Actinomycetota bacterium]
MCHETLTHLCIPATEKILRTVAVYSFLVVGLRLAGKRELGQLNPFDLVVLITIANAVQNAIIGPDNTLTGGLIGGAVLLVVNYGVARLTYRFAAADRLLVGKESTLFADGKLNKRILQRERITREELMAAARNQGVRSLEEVDRIVLETNGVMSVIMKEDLNLRAVLAELRDLKKLVSAKG